MPPSNEIKITRLYDAPLSLVWDAWVDPEKKKHWWGPRGFTITTHSSDIRTGGSWNYTMHGPDGVDYPNVTKYHEVKKHQLLDYDHGANETQPALFRVRVEFSETNGQTLMEMKMIVGSPEAAQQMKKFIKAAGGNSTWDRLGEYLEENEDGAEVFFINRTFEAPIETVFDMWTNPKHFVKWLPPTGLNMKFIRDTIAPGASTFFSMSNGDTTMYGRAEYIEIERPHRLIYKQQFCDANERVTRHPMAPTWPETMLTVVTFHAEGANETRVTIKWEIEGPATAEERATFKAEKGGMTQGWTGSFDKLEQHLEDVKNSH